MPKGTATTTISSMLSAVPPRACQRRVAMIKATMIPAMMQSAYARSGNAPMYQMFVLGLGMDRTACAQPAVTTLSPSRPVFLLFLRSACDRQPTLTQVSLRPRYFLAGARDHCLERLRSQVRNVNGLAVDQHGRGLCDAVLVGGRVDRGHPIGMRLPLHAGLERLRGRSADLGCQVDQLRITPLQRVVGEQSQIVTPDRSLLRPHRPSRWPRSPNPRR